MKKTLSPDFLKGSRVLRTWTDIEGSKVYRQRKMPDGTRIDTLEVPLPPFEIRNRGGAVEFFDPNQLRDSIWTTFHKTPPPEDKALDMLGGITRTIFQLKEKRQIVTTSEIRDITFDALVKLNPLFALRYFFTYYPDIVEPVIRQGLLPALIKSSK